MSAAAHGIERQPPLATRQRAARHVEGPPSSLAWWMFVVYIVLEFDRPPGLAALKLQLVISLALPLIWMTAKDRPWSGVLTAQVLLIPVTLVMLPFAVNYYAVYFTTRTLFSSIGVGIAMSWLFANRTAMRKYYWAWLLVISWVGLYGITHGGRGPGGFLGDENDLALACVGAFPFAFYGFQLLGGWQRFVAGGLGVVLVMAIVTSLSRGGFVGLVAALGWCLLSGSHKVRNILLAIVAAGVFFLAVPQSYLDEMSTIQNTDSGTADTRQFLWLTAFNIWKEKPIFGAGGGNFNYVAGEHTPKGGRWDTPGYQERSWSGTTVHSAYFQILSELGLAGVLCYGAMLYGHFKGIATIRKRSKKRRDLPPALRNEIELYAGSLAAGMIGTLGAGAFLSAAFYPYAYLYASAGVALATWADRALSDSKPKGQGVVAAPP